MLDNEILYLNQFPFFLAYCKQRSVSPPAGIVCYLFYMFPLWWFYIKPFYLQKRSLFYSPIFCSFYLWYEYMFVFHHFELLSFEKNNLHLKPLLLVASDSIETLLLIFFTLKGFYLCHYHCILLFPNHSHIPSKDPVLIWFEFYFSHSTKTISKGRKIMS